MSFVGTKSGGSLNKDTLVCREERARPSLLSQIAERWLVLLSLRTAGFKVLQKFYSTSSFLIKHKEGLILLIISTPPKEQLCSINTLHKRDFFYFWHLPSWRPCCAPSGHVMRFRHVSVHFLRRLFPLPSCFQQVLKTFWACHSL